MLRYWLLLSWLCATPAWAHSAFGSGESVISGALHLLTSPLSMAALVGSIAALCGFWHRTLVAVGLIFAFTVAVGSSLGAGVPAPWVGFAAPAGVVIVGLSAVAGRTLHAVSALVLACVAGLTVGLATGLDVLSPAAVLGAVLAASFIGAIVLSGYLDLEAMPHVRSIAAIARRVLGAWVAAIGLLVLALALRGVAGTS